MTGTAAAGQQTAASGVLDTPVLGLVLGQAANGRPAAGPAIMVSFLLVAIACAFAGLCYAELAAMIPVAGSAYTYAYATLGELVAWIIGWDLILEYAVGNVAVAINWAEYFKSLLGDVGVVLPIWLTTGYRTALLSPDPAVHGLLATAPHIGGFAILLNIPAFAIVGLITWLLLLGVRESARTNNVLVAIKLVVLTLFVIVGVTHLHPENYHPFAPNGFPGIHHGAAIIFFAYIGFDAISTAAEETKNPQRNMPLGIMGGLAICTVIYIVIGIVLTGMVPAAQLGVADPLAKALTVSGFQKTSAVLSLGAVFALTAVLLVFQYGQPRIFFSMARDGLLPRWAARVHPKYRVPWATTIVTGVAVAAWAMIGDAGETYDLTNIGTLFAFVLVCIGVLVLRYKDPTRVRPFKVPFIWPVSLGGAGICIFLMNGLPHITWVRFYVWLVIGLAVYLLYGVRHSVMRRRAAGEVIPDSGESW
jgi:APA family basic amino acid/polyamine antiporter